MSFITEFVTDIVYIAGKENVVADTLSRQPDSISINSAVLNSDVSKPACDLPALARAQQKCGNRPSNLKAFDIGLKDFPLYCEVSQPSPRPFVPQVLRKQVFSQFHDLSHPSSRATTRLIQSRYFWPDMAKDIKLWSSECLPCEQCKIGRHTRKPITDLPHPSQRFTVVHIDIIGALEPPDTSDLSNRPRYVLTMIDSYTRWIEACPIFDISCESVAKAFLSTWIARFGPPLTLISDRGTQFRAELLQKLNSLLGIHHIRTSSYNPRANGMVERSHRTLKSALKARGSYWLDQLPIVLFGMRIHPDEDCNSPYSLTFGEQPLVPPILPHDIELKEFSTRLHQLFHPYRLPRERQIKTYIPPEIKFCSHAWLRLDRVKSPLEAPYQGPFKVIDRSKDTCTLEINKKPETVSIDRIKPTILPSTPISAEDQPKSEKSEPNLNAKGTLLRSGKRVTFRQ